MDKNKYDFSELDFFFHHFLNEFQDNYFSEQFENIDENLNSLNLPYLSYMNMIYYKSIDSSNSRLCEYKLYEYYLIIKYIFLGSEELQKKMHEKFEFVDKIDFYHDPDKIFDVMNDDIISEFTSVEEINIPYIGIIGHNIINLQKKVSKFIFKYILIKMIYRLTYFISGQSDYGEKDFKKDFVSRFHRDLVVCIHKFDDRSEPEYILNLIINMNYYKSLFIEYINKNYCFIDSYDYETDVLCIKEYGIATNNEHQKKEYIKINKLLEKETNLLNSIYSIYYLKSKIDLFEKREIHLVPCNKRERWENFKDFCQEYLDAFPGYEVIMELSFFQQYI